MATARKLPSGSWRVLLYVGKDENGVRQYKSFTGDTKKEAEYSAAIFALTQKEKPRSDMTIGKAAEQYLKDRSAVLSPSTLRGYTSIQKSDAFLQLAKVKISSLTESVVQRWVNQLAVNHSPKTVRNYHFFLSAILTAYAPEFSMSRIKLPQKNRPQLSIPTEEEVRALIEYFHDDTETQTAIMLAAFLGLRRGEISALKFSDLQDDKLTIARAMALNTDHKFVEKSPKSVSGVRTLIVPQPILRNIETLKQKKGDRIIPCTPSALTDRFLKARTRLGFTWRFHDLRHYNASVMLALGVPDKYAMQRMGHATSNMLKTVYQHTFTQREIEVANLVNARMEATMQHEMQHEPKEAQ